jgi:hypothetical protein
MIRTIFTPDSKQITLPIPEKYIGTELEIIVFPVKEASADFVSFDDCQHIANAIISGCDIIVSWNFKHIVNHKTMMGVKAITALEGYDDLLIYDPSILIGGEEDDT